MWGAHEGMGWWMLMGSAWFFLFWGLLTYLIVSAMGRSGTRSRDGSGDESPLDILKRRYARGELTRQEFERMRRELA
jgi:putative membrane protein